jgi:hypothetical protein
MSRISDILIRVRDTLADPSGDRWDDPRLLRLVDEAQKDIVRHAKLLNKTYSTIIPANTNSVELPDDLMLLTRVTVNNEKLDFISRENLDKVNTKWELDVGKPEYIITDKIGPKEIQIYPILEDTNYSLTVPGTAFTIDDYGVVAGIEDGTSNISDLFGTVSQILESSYLFVIHYLKKPETISSVEDLLEIDELFDKAIKYYVVGKALRDDMDTQNRAVGNEELGFYTRELEEAIKEKALDYVTTGKRFEIPYMGAF